MKAFSKELKGYNSVTAMAAAITGNHWKSFTSLTENGNGLEPANDGGDAPLLRSLFFHSNDSLEPGYQKIDSDGDFILQDVAIFRGLRMVDIIHATKLDGRNARITNKQGKNSTGT